METQPFFRSRLIADTARKSWYPGTTKGAPPRRNVTVLKLYGFSKSRRCARGHTCDLRVLWALEEMQLPFELVGMDHPAHDLSTETCRRLSPFEPPGISRATSRVRCWQAYCEGRCIRRGTR